MGHESSTDRDTAPAPDPSDHEPSTEALEIHGLGASGDGVGRLADGRVVFVEGALPGDRVEVLLGERRKKVQFASLREVLRPSPERVVSRCPHETCGGCPLSSYSAAGQADAKRSRVVETLRRIGHLEAEELLSSVRQFGDGWGYRHRVRLHAAWTDVGWEIGYHARRSRTVSKFDHCPALLPELSVKVAEIAGALASLPRAAQLTELELAYSRRDDRVAARLTARGPLAIFREATPRLQAAGLLGLEVETPKGCWRSGNLELRLDHARADAFDIRFEPSVFSQANSLANDGLVAGLLDAVRPREHPRVLELHAGIGNFSLALAQAGARLVAVERQRRAAILGRRNARLAGLGIEVHEASDDEALTPGSPILAGDPFEVVVLDPPRTGAFEACKLLAQHTPRRIVYVSCDPATLARDAAWLCDHGYALRHLEAYDMFPQTPHVEMLAVLRQT